MRFKSMFVRKFKYGHSVLTQLMSCPFLRECFEESINKKSYFFEKNRCTHKENWSRCPIHAGKSKLKEMEEDLEQMLEPESRPL